MALTVAQRNYAERDPMDHQREELARGAEGFTRVYLVISLLIIVVASAALLFSYANSWSKWLFVAAFIGTVLSAGVSLKQSDAKTITVEALKSYLSTDVRATPSQVSKT